MPETKGARMRRSKTLLNPESDLAYAKRGDVYKAAGNVGQAAGDYKTALSKSHDEKLKAVVGEKLKNLNSPR